MGSSFMIIHQKIVACTGCNRGIGLSFVQAAARERSHLILINRKRDESLERQLLDQGALSVKTFVCDLSDSIQLQQLSEQLVNEPIDVFFNNAGLLTGGLIENQKWDDIEKMLFVNINALIRLSQLMVQKMLKVNSGLIINHGSVSSIMHFPCASTYSAAKAAVWAFTDCIEQELKGTGVKTLCLITPGIKTEMFDAIEKLYSDHINVPQDSLNPDQYAQQIMQAIQKEKSVLWPSGSTGMGLFISLHFRSLFNKLVRIGFKRSN